MRRRPSSFTEPFVVVDNFLEKNVADTMRAAVETHFREPFKHTPERHMVWNYWYVPGLYTYLRSLPETVLGEELSQQFHEALAGFAIQYLGMSGITWPYISMYVDGCRQNQHNDSGNGRFGYVFSLTKNDRKTSGGETLLWHELDYFGSLLHRPMAGQGFYESVEPLFNRLLVFDDRLPHAVQMVEGIMDPLEGRIVLHGHIYEKGPIVEGPLGQNAVVAILEEMAKAYSLELGDALMNYHGPAAVRFSIEVTGVVSKSAVILDRVRKLSGDGPEAHAVVGEFGDRIRRLQFPAAESQTIVTLPVGFGNRLAELR
jgi:hypothetical protein